MDKRVQLPESFVKDVYRLILDLYDYELDADVSSTINRLETALNDKIMANEKRQAYVAYKTAASFEERETARQKYLDLAGINPDWRWGAETDLKNKRSVSHKADKSR